MKTKRSQQTFRVKKGQNKILELSNRFAVNLNIKKNQMKNNN